MHHAFKRAATGAALALLLAACGGSDDDNDTVTDNDSPQSQFGSTFEEASNRSATGEPVAGLAPGALGGVSFTADPVAVD